MKWSGDMQVVALGNVLIATQTGFLRDFYKYLRCVYFT